MAVPLESAHTAERVATERPTVVSAPPPRQGRSREKLDRLLAAGAQLFGENGFEGTIVSDVAELAGCSVGVFYQRFADKDAFFAAVRSRWTEQAMARLDQSIAATPSPLPAPELLRFFVQDALALFHEQFGLIRAFLIYEADHPESSAPMLEFAHAIADRQAERLLADELVARHPEPALAVRFALEVLRATLVYLVLHNAEAPLRLDDERLPLELERMLGAYLGAAEWARASPASDADALDALPSSDPNEP